jgi:hypothetical protein
MDPLTDKPSELQSFPRLSAGCPFLGLREDAETHFSTPSVGNYCHKVNPSEPVNFDHQENYCLSDLYLQCVVFSNEWKELLPDTIRGDGVPGSRPSVQKTAIISSAAIDTGEAQESKGADDIAEEQEFGEEFFLPSSSISQADSQSIEDIKNNLPWKRLHEEARSRYLETKPNRRERYLWSGLIVIASIIFLVSIYGLFNRYSELQTQAELSMFSARTLTAIYAEEQSIIADAATATANALFFIEDTTPTPAIIEEDEVISDFMTATAQVEIQVNKPVDVCSELSSYPLVIVSGPHLTPRPGYIYQPDSPEPTIQASWIIKNPGECKWEQIVLQDVNTGENIVPFLKQNGIQLDLTDLEQVINPEEDVEVTIGFRVRDAETINREWLLLINGFNLFSQPHITLKIDDWIIIQQATATPTKQVVKPTSKPPKATATPGRVTEAPPTRSP